MTRESTLDYTVSILGRLPRYQHDHAYTLELDARADSLVRVLGQKYDITNPMMFRSGHLIPFLSTIGQIHYVTDCRHHLDDPDHPIAGDGHPDQVVGIATVVAPNGNLLCGHAIIHDLIVRTDLGDLQQQRIWAGMLVGSVMIDLRARATQRGRPIHVSGMFPFKQRPILDSALKSAGFRLYCNVTEPEEAMMHGHAVAEPQT